MNYYVTDNTGASVALNDIPEVSYAAFYEDLRVKLSDARYHAAHYFALPSGDRMRFFLLLLDDAERLFIAAAFEEAAIGAPDERTRAAVARLAATRGIALEEAVA